MKYIEAQNIFITNFNRPIVNNVTQILAMALAFTEPTYYPQTRCNTWEERSRTTTAPMFITNSSNCCVTDVVRLSKVPSRLAQLGLGLDVLLALVAF